MNQYERIVVLSERHSAARKAHACEFCPQSITVGERYTRLAFLGDGVEFASAKFHDCCNDGTYECRHRVIP